ncbi:alpha/beta fold hydrolase [Cellulosimicrobium protaetiae]|uniref:Alpha/beta hydrolase n=1 Tax=Cellulosimicrobium protaetiae TaxID=2587808 RepID=A0A6M5UK11_9MICO|nr:alpha/beta hydrolase [Cellulosimicrobium protaetiae]QJW37448.1 alpha/beta hydrolase [Cellulosimicrobium protaetiae]
MTPTTLAPVPSSAALLTPPGHRTDASAAGPDVPPAVVFVHGMRTSSAIWDRQVEHVRGLGHDAVAVDLPAHGTRAHERFTLDRSFEVLDEAVASFGPGRRVALVGLSLGGYTSLAWAARRPANLAGVVAAACTSDPKGKPVALYRDVARLVVAGGGAVGRGARWAARTSAAAWGTIARGGRSLPAGAASSYALAGPGDATGTTPAAPGWHVVTDALTQLAGRSWLAHVRDVDVPVWLVNGARDHLRLDEQRYLAAAPDAALVVVPRAGHDVNSEAPEAFNRVLGRALADFGRVRGARLGA